MEKLEHLQQGDTGAEEGSQAASRPLCLRGYAKSALSLVGKDLELKVGGWPC